ncbi:FAD-dependent oxidoreductase [Agaricicola taiwanensis]|uniref:FAD-dependent oxidoreductase n=1 Tax=Agaricicola taiwanensis TaxID=591372 RepID=A0A8J2YH81_9RHOB|nr:FAD-binding oxidoreductase [Agaricicola taiwanensis]GGE41672.1 FAD-dependent oxidoreductase [Agaricicola taiwanensis]
MRKDVTILGAGIVGISTALHLQARGLDVALVDRRAPGEETSFGNAGVIETSALFPVAFPRNITTLMKVGLKRAPQANYSIGGLASVAPWLWSYFRNSTPDKLEHTARTLYPLVSRALEEHEPFIAATGAERYLRRTGWMRVYRSEMPFNEEKTELALADELGVPYEIHETEGALKLEPYLAPVFRHAVLWTGTASVSDPGAVVAGYARLFEECGGLVTKGDALSLAKVDGLYRVETAAGSVAAERVVLALGPWTNDVLTPKGYRLPLATKRGYHMHYKPVGEATLRRPVVDVDGGYCLSSMTRGLRLTTGVEFAGLRAQPTPTQITRTRPYLDELFPHIEGPVDPEPWVGNRPCLPDSIPIIGPSPEDPDLWLAFGHQHLGFTLGPVTGRLLAEMMQGENPLTDPAPFRAERFG